jgi:hypothetical protein
LLASRRASDEHATRALFEKARFGEVQQQYVAHLTVEACQERGVSSGELHVASLREQMLDTGEGLFETPCLDWLRHVR